MSFALIRSEYLRPTNFPVSFVDLIRLLRVRGRGDKRQAKLLVLLLRVKNSMWRTARDEIKREGKRKNTFTTEQNRKMCRFFYFVSFLAPGMMHPQGMCIPGYDVCAHKFIARILLRMSFSRLLRQVVRNYRLFVLSLGRLFSRYEKQRTYLGIPVIYCRMYTDLFVGDAWAQGRGWSPIRTSSGDLISPPPIATAITTTTTTTTPPAATGRLFFGDSLCDKL